MGCNLAGWMELALHVDTGINSTVLILRREALVPDGAIMNGYTSVAPITLCKVLLVGFGSVLNTLTLRIF